MIVYLLNILLLLCSLQASATDLHQNDDVAKLSYYEIGEKILNRYIRLQNESKVPWEYNWTNGVALYGTNKFLKASQISLESREAISLNRYIKKFKDVLDFQITRGLPEVTAPDLVAMSFGALSFMELELVENCNSCDQIIENTITFFDTEPLNWVNAYDHVGKRYRIRELPFPPRWLLGSCIFIDSAMAYIPEGVRISIMRNDQKALNFFLNQYDIFHEHLYVKKTGLYKQAYYPYLERKDPKSYTWSRGNMYMALGMLDTLEILPPTNKYFEILKMRTLNLLKLTMNYVDLENGLKTLTDDPSRNNYFESSSSAFLVANILKASRIGILNDEELVNQALLLGENLKKYLKIENKDEISINQVSGATTAFYPDWYYKLIIRPTKDRTTGIGAYTLMLSELILRQSI